MIQDIAPQKLDNSFVDRIPEGEDTVFAFDADGSLYANITDKRISFTLRSDFPDGEFIYLFSIDDKRYFLRLGGENHGPADFDPYPIRKLRDNGSGSELFAAFTAYHLWRWYADNRFCGCCGAELSHSKKERALCCDRCGNTVYPRINPAVIVGVLSGDKILITRYRTGYSHNALIAGFAEIGETLEETVSREVMEEAGIKVKNIRYYKSQPWGVVDDILVGFYCDVDGDDTIRMDEGELKVAEWRAREEIELQPDDFSLTNEMMKMFKESRA